MSWRLGREAAAEASSEEGSRVRSSVERLSEVREDQSAVTASTRTHGTSTVTQSHLQHGDQLRPGERGRREAEAGEARHAVQQQLRGHRLGPGLHWEVISWEVISWEVSWCVQLGPGEVEVVEGVAPDGGGEEAAELGAGQLRVGEVQPRHLSMIMCCHFLINNGFAFYNIRTDIEFSLSSDQTLCACAASIVNDINNEQC